MNSPWAVYANVVSLWHELFMNHSSKWCSWINHEYSSWIVQDISKKVHELFTSIPQWSGLILNSIRPWTMHLKFMKILPEIVQRNNVLTIQLKKMCWIILAHQNIPAHPPPPDINPWSPHDALKHHLISLETYFFSYNKGFRTKISMKLVHQYVAIFFDF